RRATAALRADGVWERGGVHAPGAAQRGDGAVLLYYGGGEGAGIGLAIAPDGQTFEKVGDRPVLEPATVTDASFWRAVDRVADPCARRSVDAAGREVIGLWFSARGVESGPTRQ